MPSIYLHLSNKQTKKKLCTFLSLSHNLTHARAHARTHAREKEKGRNNRATERTLEHTGASGHRAVTCCASTFPGFARHRLESCPSQLIVKAKGGFQLKEKKKDRVLNSNSAELLTIESKNKTVIITRLEF